MPQCNRRGVCSGSYSTVAYRLEQVELLFLLQHEKARETIFA